MIEIVWPILMILRLPTLHYQELPQHPIRDIHVWSVNFRQGKPQFLLSVLHKANITEFEELLHENSVRRELDLVPDQIVEIDKLLSMVGREGTRILVGLENVSPSESQLKELQSIRTEVSDQLNDVLLQHQSDRLNEIKERVLLRTIGYKSYLDRCESVFGIKLNETQRNAIDKKMKVFREKVAEFAENEVSLSLKKILSPLSSTQFEKLMQIGKDNGLVSGDLDVHLAQLKFCQKLEGEIGSGTDAMFDRMLENRPWFFVGFDGDFEARPWTDRDLIANLVDEFRKIQDNPLQLTRIQIETLVDIRLKNKQKSNDLVQDQRLELLNQGSISFKYNENFIKQMSALSNELQQGYLDVLSQEQRLNLRIVIAKKLSIEYGLITWLLKGELRSHLDIDENQIERIESLLETEVVRLERNGMSFERELIEIVVGELPNDLRLKVNKAIGSDFDDISPTFHFLAWKGLGS